MQVRTAGPSDIGGIERLIEMSVRGLQAGDYTPAQLDLALNRVFGVDRQLIADQTYFLVEDAGVLIGCGGWSYRRTLFGADAVQGRDETELNPGVDAAKIRAFFVHPHWARRGVATQLLECCEAAARQAGFTRLELGATLTGIPFYARHGFVAGDRMEAPLGEDASRNATSLTIVRMTKTIG